MRVIATILFLAMTVQMPMALHVAAKNEEVAAEPAQTLVFEVADAEAQQETADLTVHATKEEEITVEAEVTEEVEEIVYKEIVKAEPIDTSKPHLQSATGTMATGNGVGYSLTASERDLVERIVMAEIGGGTYTDKLAVAQCIYDRVKHYGKSVEAVIYQKNAFTDPSKKTPSKSVKQAVSEVFDDGKRVTEEPIFYFIATYAVTAGCFHETQRCLLVTDAHRYYTTW